MPKKPQKWGLKIWCLADSVTQYVSNFDVYCGASMESLDDPSSKNGEAKQGQKVVESLVCGLENRGHVVVIDNFFSSVEFFRDLEQRGIILCNGHGKIKPYRAPIHYEGYKTIQEGLTRRIEMEDA